jgi:acyl-CoA synthetase (AMP-forming)/AMP-acid ligase II
VFGPTECCGFISQTHLDDPPDVVAETLGSPLDGIDVRVVDPDTGNVVAVGDVGELEVHGYNVMAGYHDNPDATAAAMRDGWLRTGDLVTLDEFGYLRIIGRLKDMIVTGGVNVYAAEVEAVLLEHPAVAEAAVFGVPDDHWGERVVAAVRTTTDTDADTLAAFLDERLARFKLPKDWVFVDAMPITPSGKIQKFLLRDRVRPV